MSEEGTIILWDIATGKKQATLQGRMKTVLSVAYSPDGKVLASGSIYNTIKLWDVSTGKERATLQGPTDPVTFSPDGKMLATGSRDQTIKVWDVPAAKKSDK